MVEKISRSRTGKTVFLSSLLSLACLSPSAYAAGSLEGYITLPGAPTIWSGDHRVQLDGIYPIRAYKWTNAQSNGYYQFTGLEAGNYRLSHSVNFAGQPITKTFFKSSSVAVSDGENQQDLTIPVGTLWGTVDFTGSWNEADLTFSRISWGGPAGVQAEMTTGGYSNTPSSDFRVIGPEGTYTNSSVQLFINNFNKREQEGKWLTQVVNLSYSTDARIASSSDITAEQTNSFPPSATRTIKSAETLVAFEVPAGNIAKVEFYCNPEFPYPRGACLGASQNSDEYDGISIDGTARNFIEPRSAELIKIRGLPGTYQMQAKITTDTGQTHSTDFTMVMSEPVQIPVGSDGVLDFTDETGTLIGTLNFNGSVTQSGATTFSELTEGPDPADGFKIFSPSGEDQYFDISTTADFDGTVQVCVNYDGSALTDTEELSLGLAHYVYDEVTKTGAWEVITDSGYPDTLNDELCGSTDSFSIFAVVESPDADGDGIANNADNCPATYNPDQSDLDGDSIGDACDIDSDGDGIPNDVDLCPTLNSPNNNDLDGDSVGDPCDADIDGDGVENIADNCPVVANSDQNDFDQDSYGDVCDPDADNDSVLNQDDFCPETEIGAIVVIGSPVENEDNGCTSAQRLEQACPSDGDYRNHGAYVSCVVDEVQRQVDVLMLHETDSGDIVSEAAKSDVGKK